MHKDKAPGPDGFNPGFYKRFWEVCGEDILSSCNSWLEAGVLPPHINDAVIALIPKCPNPSNMKELRPIALCNVIYKILSKALANRLKPLLHNWMMMCITSVHFQVLLNGNRVGSIVPGRGLRQGDPISPYLFILGMEGLSSLIHKAKLLGNLQGIQIIRGAPKLHHLMFADDVFLFFQATEKETKEVASILETFEIASGQAINFDKSEVFLNRHAPPAIHNMLSNILHVHSCETTSKYLGLPSMIGRNKNDVFRYIKERIWKKLQSWSHKSLSKAGKETLIKSVLQALPSYAMSVFMIPPRTIDEIEKLLNAFWWGANSNTHKGIKWMRWDKLTIPKPEGGLGFKNLSVFNLAILGKQAWRLLTNPNSLISKIYRAKYYPDGNFLNAPLGHNPSYTWKSLWSTQHLLKNGSRWRLGNGNTIPVWGEPWIKYNNNYHCIHPHDPSNSHDLKVSDLMSKDKLDWNADLINSIFDIDTSNHILNIPILNPHCEDKRIWDWNPSGSYTVRSAYKGFL
uniref:Ribonuclease H protein At1g65750 family n=1 Tax=Cajanus cajan TaxID=3821 RepID=A0A151RNM9_CAJCA|nr:Putative ribonuclease H protein At1g65750 family [Cajanus cajan]